MDELKDRKMKIVERKQNSFEEFACQILQCI